MINLYDAINSSYGQKNSIKELEKNGYAKDNSLSNHNQSVYVNNKDKKLLYNVAGSHNAYDFIVPDIQLAIGRLKESNRYKEAENTLKKAKDKYKGYSTTLTGHSLSGAIVNGIAKKGDNDKVYSLNGAYTLGQKTTNNKNFHNYRVQGDIVSLLGKGNKNLKTIKNNDFIHSGVLGAYFSHQPRHIKKQNIFI